MDALSLPHAQYLSLPSSIVPAQGEVKSIVDEYLEKYPTLDDDDLKHIKELIPVIDELEDGGELGSAAWLARARYFISAAAPELAAFDAHKAYLQNGGVYHGPLMEPIEGELKSEGESKAILVLSRALFLAGCYTESHLLILQKTDGAFHNSTDEDDIHMATLFNATEKSRDAATMQYRGTSIEQDDCAESILPPALRDGSVRVVKYPFISNELLRLPESAAELFNEELTRISSARCIIKAKPAAAVGDSSGEGNESVEGIFVTRKIDEGQLLFSENTAVAFKLHDTGIVNACKYCHQDVPEKHHQDGKYHAGDRFCNEQCLDKFSRAVRVPEDLLAAYLRMAVDFVEKTGRHPLECREIAGLAANYGSTMSFSYDRHVAKAIDTLKDLGISVFSNSTFDGPVVMNILARLQHNTRAFDVDEKIAKATVCPIISLIKNGEEANVVVKWVEGGDGGRVIVTAKCSLNEGDELFVGPI